MFPTCCTTFHRTSLAPTRRSASSSRTAESPAAAQGLLQPPCRRVAGCGALRSSAACFACAQLLFQAHKLQPSSSSPSEHFRAAAFCLSDSQGWGLPLSSETQAKGINSCSFFPFLLATGMNFSLEPAGRSETHQLRAAQALLCPSDAGLLSCCSCGTQCCVHPHCPQGVPAWAGDASASGGGERKPRARPHARPQPCDGEQAFGANI